MSGRKRTILRPKEYYEDGDAVAYFLRKKDLYPKEAIAFEPIPDHSRLLDIACGAGRTTAIFRDRGLDVVGVDLSFGLIKAAKERLGTVPLMVNDACTLSLKSGQFDVVVFSMNGIDCISPYENRLKALNEVKRVLKPTGRFIFSSHNHCFPRDRDGIMPFLKCLFRRERNTYVTDTHYPWGATRIYLTTPRLQIKEAEALGFRFIRLVTRRMLRHVKSLSLIGLLDGYCYYVFELTGE